MNHRILIERYLPHGAAAEICHQLAKAAIEADEDPSLCAELHDMFLSPLKGLAIKDSRKFARRFDRVVHLMMADTYDHTVALGLSALTIITNALIDADAWAPDDAYLDAWGRLSNAVYDRAGNGALLNTLDDQAADAAQSGINRLQREGYYLEEMRIVA